MKRGFDEKNIDQMFPRIHVNDTEKGGPRAPPRNKMALYEQLSIPSQRFSSEGGVSERGSFFPHQQTPTMHAADETNNRHSELNTQLVNQVQKQKQEHEDLRVPISVQQSGINLDHSGNHQRKDNETLSPYNLPFSDCLTNAKKTSERNKIQLNEANGASSFDHGNVSNTNGNLRDRVVDSVDHIRAVGRSYNDHTNGDDASENSMVDSISGVSPDDVVGIIGQKLFWKTRRDIINQQRVFAVQVFELHRLIKVQRLIAGSPDVMIETDAFIGNPSKVSQINKVPLDYARKSSTNVPKVKDYHEKSNHDNREFSAENAVEKAALSSVQKSNGSTLKRYPLPPPDPTMGQLSQQPGQQWLIPVMSPSEGLIYKPYPAPGYMTPGPGPPPGHNFVNHGVPPPAQPHYQWPTGFPPLVYPPSHGYFPPYGTTTMNPSSGEEVNPNPFNMRYQSSCNVPTVVNFQESNNEVQISTASCPSERTNTRDALSLFPTYHPAEGPAEPTRAIRAVPRKARLATESAAWIFRCIQEERKQQDSV
ncbi:putative protein EARLY FLOWERING 3 [Helianthus annuus]|uniref:Hydroxyproline-rich glycoprotein family protein n=1 Tax=Helianthus annuus TaxID=4232 RepID=A0A251RLL9_HELAN|nr:ELF3-like protein 2 [Helianthus annuus]XP_035842604.1 ELF3-like protein 2 [Helianthus annuus]KAF5753973.1 putative protein EARLY FLOWERING 3 [Helianthus annuus]KAJ0427954.1 putative protein EARLY FLOWERING 3 [Helianthus annuus]KAJ0446263.1 putative protein EARLY FLOWERING 3 [Helianthus annuus]